MRRRLDLPGNPRYQPKAIQDIFGYDNLYRPAIEVEIAVMRTLGGWGIIPEKDFNLFTIEVVRELMQISTSEVDKVEREVTKHDVRALVRLMQERMPEPLRRWVHVPLTSYDVLSTAQTLQFRRAHIIVLERIDRVKKELKQLIVRHADNVQVGRTHGQHAIPITFGFWLATVYERIVQNQKRLDERAGKLVGKISGPVGAYNAQVALGMYEKNGCKFEEEVLRKLGLQPARISTQITMPEPLADYLFACVLMSATLGQFARDCRELMRPEIGEITEAYDKGQVGSSTMAHKRNPISFENIEGTWLKNQAEFSKVFATLISSHQRDLVGSCIMRDFPTIVVNLVSQLETLLREKGGKTFLARMHLDTVRARENLELQGSLMLAEPMYLALQAAGYKGDAHELVNHTLVPLVLKQGCSLWEALMVTEKNDRALGDVVRKIPGSSRKILSGKVQWYVGMSGASARQVVNRE